jgi:dihydropteroate synthase
MGIVNVTPDSFSDGGRHADTEAALAHAEALVADGADLLDIGGESTRPGADEIPDAEQVRRVVPLIREITSRHPGVPVSIDTRSADVARAAVEAGASIVNDVSAFAHDPELARVTAELRAPAVLMHMRGSPADMRELTDYEDLVSDVLAELRGRLDAARAAGVEHLIADPGIGFAKTAEQSAALLAATAIFAELGTPLLVGPSRKSFLALATGERDGDPATTRRDATVAAAGIAALLGAHIVRVHDVRACGDAVRLADALRASAEWTSPDETARMTRRPSPI